MIRVAIAGASGRMGQTLIATALETPNITLAAAIDRADSEVINKDAATLVGQSPQELPIQASLENVILNLDTVVDFTVPAATLAHIKTCVEHQKSIVIGTTGFTDQEKKQIEKAATKIPIVFAPNMSTGVNLTFKLVEMAAKVLGPQTDIEVIEAHHRNKIDAPSGTALKLGEAAAEALGWSLPEQAVFSREGITGTRPENTIGFATIRAGDIVGEHTVLFAGQGEHIEITHKAKHRSNFAHGALRAVEWLQNRAPGLYDMQDVLDLTD